MDITLKEILRQALPLGFANMSVVLMPLMDAVMLGRHDAYSMASGGLAMQIYLILFTLGEESSLASDQFTANIWMPPMCEKCP